RAATARLRTSRSRSCGREPTRSRTLGRAGARLPARRRQGPARLQLKQFGVGLAAAILIDATLVRAVLLPATMKLLGERNWYLPRWLEWLPRLEHEEPSAAPDAPAVPASA